MKLRRRIPTVGGLAASAGILVPAWAQPRKATIAMLMFGRRLEDDTISVRFVDEMRRRGWTEGQNVSYQRFFTEGSRERADELAAAAARSRPDLIFTPTGAGVLAAMKATDTTPIVFIITSDPVASGMVKSLRQPGRNATGVFQMGAEIISKRFELIRESLPRARRVGVLLDSGAGDYAFQKRQHAESPRPKGMTVVIDDVARFDEVPAALQRLKKDGAEILILAASFTLSSNRAGLIAAALEHRLPVVAYSAPWADAGALISYGADTGEVYRRVAQVADRLLRGARPAETPVEQATKFELILNLRTAKALGLTLPRNFLLRADRIIE